MAYSVYYFAEALDDLDDIPARYKRRVIEKVTALANDPYPSRSKQLRDPLGHLRRIPLEQWRIIYEVFEVGQEVWIHRIKLKIGPETYDDLDEG